MRARAIRLVALTMCAMSLPVVCAGAITEQEFRARVVEATKGFQDITMVGTVSHSNKKALAKIDPAYSRIYDFRSASVSFRYPDKLRMEGKLGMVKFEYIVNGGVKVFRAPTVRISKKEDYSDDPAKTQNALDVGLVTPSLWSNRRVEIQDDPDAHACGEIKLRLYWPKGDMIYLAWVDAKDLYLKRFEKRDAQNVLQVKVVYSEPVKAGGVIWMPTKVEVYAPDGEKAGESEMRDIKVNTGLQDSLFQ